MNKQTNISCSAPGSLILLGEYAVLHGSPAVVVALDKRIRTRINNSNDDGICIRSDLGCFKGSLETLKNQPKFNYVCACIMEVSPHINHVEIIIESDFSSKWGLGSSAAVTIATLAALNTWIHGDAPSDEILLTQAMSVLQYLDKKGSGADMAASIYGRVIKYHHQGATYLPPIPQLFAIYTGKKASTDQAIDRTTIPPQLLSSIDKSTHHGIDAILKSDWKRLAEIMNQQHQYLVALGTQTPNIAAIVQSQQSSSSIAGIKISGAGFGDCLIGLSHQQCLLPALHKHLGAFYLKSTIADRGVTYETT